MVEKAGSGVRPQKRKDRECGSGMAPRAVTVTCRCFSLNELLVIAAVLCLLSTILLPVLTRVRATMITTICKDSISQLTNANLKYSLDNDNRLCPGKIGRNLRWFGVRNGSGSFEFDFTKGPLGTYVRNNDSFRMCPALKKMLPKEKYPYDTGTRGYGYNLKVGSLRAMTAFNWDNWEKSCEELGFYKNKIKNPSRTVMFTDAATLVDKTGNINIAGKVAEYGFCHSYDFYNRGHPAWGIPIPSIHFRHGNNAVISWVNGSVSVEKMNYSMGEWGKSLLGFFGPENSSLFDPL